MAYKITEAWNESYCGPFARRDGSTVSLLSRFVEDGFVKYRASDGTVYHASGRPEGATTDELDIDGKVVFAPKAPAKKKKKTTRRRLDTRLAHLLKLHKQAARDVERYVTNKWPPSKNISYEHQGEHRTGKVMYHDTDDRCVVVYEEDKQRKLRVPYTRIKDRRTKTL